VPTQSHPLDATEHPDVLYVSHADAVALLSVEQTMRGACREAAAALRRA
jgi:hypothetical protein